MGPSRCRASAARTISSARFSTSTTKAGGAPDLTIGPRAFKDDDGWLLDADAVELAVEVSSPSERLKGINEKTAWYAAAGVARLLQVDPRTGTWSLFGRHTS
ncbi:Uma2 family endonuclease [Streptomyces sp. NPDC001858]